MPSRVGSRNWRSYGVGASAIAFGVTFAVFVSIEEYFPGEIAAGIFLGVLPGTAFVVVGIRAIRRPTELAKALGAAVGALSGPLYYFMLGLAHPNNSGVDFGRAFVAFFVLLLLPVNMRIGTRVGARVAEWSAGGPPVGYRPGTSARAVARSIGLGVTATAVLILWQASLETSPDPRIAHWEFVHHGILPAVPIAIVGALTAAFPSRLPVMGGALLGIVPALLCSSLMVDPDPANHGQTTAALIAYSLPITVPISVGLGVLWADRIDRRIRGFVK